MENNGSDCGPILLADAEIVLGKVTLDHLPQVLSHLRLRYLAILLAPELTLVYKTWLLEEIKMPHDRVG